MVLNQKCIRDFSVDYAKGRRHDPALRKKLTDENWPSGMYW